MALYKIYDTNPVSNFSYIIPTETPRDFMRPIKYGERGNLTKNIWQR